MTPDAYDLLNHALWLWQQNAMANNNASDINKKTGGIKLVVKTPEGFFDAKNIYYDGHHGIVVEASIGDTNGSEENKAR